MEPQKYGYTAQCRVGSAEYTYRPLVDVAVGSKTKTRTFKALIDSGTEITVMDLSIAVLLDIDSRGREMGRLAGLEQWKEGFIAPVSLTVHGFEHVFHFNVLFIEDVHRNFDILLGQQDFFLNFEVTFKKSENAFYLQRSPSLFV